MEKDPFKEYLRESEPDKAYKDYAWSTANNSSLCRPVFSGIINPKQPRSDGNSRKQVHYRCIKTIYNGKW